MSVRQVVLLEDDPDISSYVARALALHGFETICFDSPGAFRMSGSVPDTAIVLLDLGFPQGNGVQILRLLAERRCRAPIILTTGAEASLVKIAQRLGRAYG